jgi:nucleotide-binding universal stress UspA family protein
MKLDKLLIPLDGSPLAETAMQKALEVAEGQQPKFVLVRAAEAAPTLTDVTQAQVDAVREAEEYLASVAKRLGTLGVRNVETSVWYGPAARSIVDAAQVQKPDFIVMSTHGRSGLGRVILGSIAEAVVRGTTTPILLLRPSGAPLDTPKGETRLAQRAGA